MKWLIVKVTAAPISRNAEKTNHRMDSVPRCARKRPPGAGDVLPATPTVPWPQARHTVSCAPMRAPQELQYIGLPRRVEYIVARLGNSPNATFKAVLCGKRC